MHLGSLYTAIASYLDAKAHRGLWRLRIDDLDTPRHEAGAIAHILQTLRDHGLHWDLDAVYQSARTARYQDALQQLEGRGLLYYCTCSRRMLAGSTTYPGTCRHHLSPRPDSALRINTSLHAHSSTQPPDFIVRRRDGLIAYQLATAVDDGADDITHVVRGNDLLPATSRQVFLMRILNLSVPHYLHLPVLLNPEGHKLSKQAGTPPLQRPPLDNLCRALELLGMAPPNPPPSINHLLLWATEQWSPQNLSPQNIRLP